MTVTVRAHGTDPNGRTVYATDYMWAVWERVVAELGFRPTIVQGAFMTRNGGGASASAGYHDLGGCFDLRVWDLTADQTAATVRALRRYGCAAWLRDQRHGGMDPHIHFVLGSDRPLTSGAAFQWQAYLNGRDGLASNGPDYHWRPDPLVTTPPEEDPMADYAKQLDDIQKTLNQLAKDSRRRHVADLNRYKRLIKKVTGIDADVERIEKALAEEPE